jgi:homoserine kinase
LKKLKIKVPATSANLGPGFDSLGLALKIYNTIIIVENKEDKVEFLSELENDFLLNPEYNNFFKILKKELKVLGIVDKNFFIQFDNNIPMARGLGSSSAVIVSSIMAAHLIAGVEFSKKKILNKALKYEEHPDNITPAVYGGFTVSILSKDKVIFQKKNIEEDLDVILAIPKIKTNTKSSRTTLKKTYKMEEIVFNISRAALVTSSFFNSDWRLLKEATKDKLHQTKRMSDTPILFDIRKEALRSGSLMSTLSGSGPTIFNLSFKKNADYIYNNLKNKFKDIDIVKTKIDNKGLTWEWL